MQIQFEGRQRYTRPSHRKVTVRKPNVRPVYKLKRDIEGMKFRRYFFRYFQTWYAKNKHRFVLPLHVALRDDTFLGLNLGQISPYTMQFGLKWKGDSFQDGWLVFFNTKSGETIDNICWMETYTTQGPDGYFCSECHRYAQDVRDGKYLPYETYLESKFFPTREALWEDHLFEAILKQANEIAEADRIDFFSDSDSFSWVRIVSKTDADKLSDDQQYVFETIKPT